MKPTWTVKLTYFKPSGKYYTDGEYQTEHEWAWRVFDEVREMQKKGNWPGLVPGQHDFYTFISFEDDFPNGYPALITPRKD